MSVSNLFRALLLLVALFAQPAMASRYAYVGQGMENSVAVIDTQDNTVVATVPTEIYTVPTAVHPAGHSVYVGSASLENLVVIQTSDNTTRAPIRVEGTSLYLALSPDGRELYVSSTDMERVTVVDTVSGTAVGTIPGLRWAGPVAFSPSGDTAYVIGNAGGELHIIDTATRTFTVVQGITWVESIAVHPTLPYVYFASRSNSSLMILDTRDNSTRLVQLASGGNLGVAVHPNGRHVYVTGADDRIHVLRASGNAIIKQVAGLSWGSLGFIAMSPTGDFAYITGGLGEYKVQVFNTLRQAFEAPIVSSQLLQAHGISIAQPLYGQGSIAAGQYHTCRIRADQALDCWGRNDGGQATAPAGSFKQVVAGSAHTCGLLIDGGVRCWGNNSYQQTAVPVGTFDQLSAGARHTCGLRSDGIIQCWGESAQGKTWPPPFTDYQVVTSGSSHSCALRSDGEPVCWGNNAAQQLTLPPGPYVQIAAGASFTCGLGANHLVTCVGDPAGGKTAPPQVPFAQIFAQSNQACGLSFDGAMVCWGPDSQGESFAPPVVHAQVAAGRFHGCSLQALGVARCWGQSLYNQAPQFVLQGSVPAGMTHDSAIIPLTVTMVVSNPGIKSPYAPRSPVYAVAAGALPPGLVLSSSGELSGRPTQAGNFNFTLEAEDLNGFTATQGYTVNVGASDLTGPVITPTVTGLLGTNGWYRGNVVVSWSVVDPESAIGFTSGCGTVVISSDTPGTTVVCEAASAAGLQSQSVFIKLDKTAPTGLPVVSKSRPLLNEPISVVANGVDAMSGVDSEVCDATPTDAVSLAGVRAYCLVSDKAGNSSRRPFSYRVIYGFQGFTGAIRNPGYWNAAGLDQPITFHYRVVDFSGAPVTGLSSPFMGSARFACPTKTPTTAPVSLSPDGLVEIGDGHYEYTWTSLSSPDCVRMFLGLGDGNLNNRVLFKFE